MGITEIGFSLEDRVLRGILLYWDFNICFFDFLSYYFFLFIYDLGEFVFKF